MRVRSGMGIGSVLGLVLGTLVLLTVFVGVVSGGLGESIKKGFGILGEKTEYTIEVKDKQTISSIARYAYDRAGNDGCRSLDKGGLVAEQNEKGGYPGLEGTYLTRYPDCRALSSTAAGGLTGVVGEEGMDSEGVFSRVQFKIPKDADPITLNKDPGSDLWIERNLLVASRQGQEEAVNENCIDNLGNIINSVPSTAEIMYFGTQSNYVVFFDTDTIDEDTGRTSIWMEERDKLDKRVYCGWTLAEGALQKLDVVKLLMSSAVYKNFYNENDITVKFCPGDKGYVQVNKGNPSGEGPLHSGEAGETISGAASQYPFIQITEVTQESC